jgi:hypothetical protein
VGIFKARFVSTKKKITTFERLSLTINNDEIDCVEYFGGIRDGVRR